MTAEERVKAVLAKFIGAPNTAETRAAIVDALKAAGVKASVTLTDATGRITFVKEQ